MRTSILFFLFIGFSFQSYSYTKDTTNYDSTEYYIKYKNKVSLWTQIGFNDAPFNLTVNFGDSIGEKKYEYRPNPRYIIGFGGAWRGVGLTIRFRIPVNLRDEKYYGKTNYFDMGLMGQYQNFLFSVKFRRYSGFALTNLNTLDSLAKDSTVFQNDITTNAFSVGATWFIFKRKYNYGCATKFAGMHTKTSWTPYVNASLTSYSLTSESAIIPNNYNPDSTRSLIAQAKTFGLRVVPGIAFILVAKGFNLNIQAGIGLIGQYNRYTISSNSDKVKNYALAPAFDLGFDIGYNIESWVIRLSLDYNLFYSKFDHIKYLQNYYTIALTVGGRIPTKKKSKKKGLIK